MYPDFSSNPPFPKRSLSFICIKYSREFEHNIAQSDCVKDKLNEFIVVDNTNNFSFSTVSQAVNHGLNKATHELVIIVHEDIFLPSNWQATFEVAINALYEEKPNWLIAGVAGWNKKHQRVGMISEPDTPHIELTSHEPYKETIALGSQMLVMRQPLTLTVDPNLPRHHHIGLDLAMQAKQKGVGSYILNTPCIHYYRDDNGRIIKTSNDSAKLQKKEQLGYLAGRACADEYIKSKWPTIPEAVLKFEKPGPFRHARTPNFDLQDQLDRLDYEQLNSLVSPFILLAKGGGGSRLLSILAEDIGLFIGNDVNPTGDSREMAKAIYRSVFRQYACPDKAQQTLNPDDIRSTALSMLQKAQLPASASWGFKVPESLFVLPALETAFPKARYVFLKRDPMTTSLRGTHMTARLDNPIGELTLPRAYVRTGISTSQIYEENKALKLARTNLYQLKNLTALKTRVSPDRWLELAFEQLLSSPKEALNSLATFTGLTPVSSHIEDSIDKDRAKIDESEHSTKTIARISTMLKDIRRELGYI